MYDGLQLNKGNLRRFGVNPDGIIDIAHGGTGADNATDALKNLGVPVFSILNYGAVADGDGQGGGTSVTAALTAALDAAVAAGGGVVLVPFSGTNIYNLPDQISGDWSNITILGEGGSTLDTTGWFPPGTPVLTQDYSIQPIGSWSDPINFSAQADMGATSIELDDVTGIVPGTLLNVTSTISCLTADVQSGVWEPADVVKWRLGNSTGGGTPLLNYYGEFVSVLSVVGNTVNLVGELFWKYPIVPVPSYGSGPTVSTARIVTPCRNFWIKDLNFTRYDATQQAVRGANIVQMVACQDSGQVGGVYQEGWRRGQAGRYLWCIDTLFNVTTKHTPGLDPSLNQDAYAAVKWSGCLRHTVVLDDYDGSQGADETYLGASGAPYNVPNMFSRISGKAQGNVDGWTSHGGSYGFSAGPFTAIRCGRNFFNRARYFSITGHECQTSLADGGAFGFGPWGCDGTVSNSRIYGAPIGIKIDRKVLDEIAPPGFNIKFSNVEVYDAGFGALLQSSLTESNAVSISVASPCVITQAGGTGIYYGCPVTFWTTGALPTGLAIDTLYYVKDKLSDATYTVSATVGGSAINTTVAGSGTQTSNWLAATTEPCGISFEGCTFTRVTNGVEAQIYWNYVTWLGGSVELTGTAPIGFRGDSGSIGHKIHNATFIANDPAAIGINVVNPTGTIPDLVFPIATYPTLRFDFGQFGSQTNTLIGTGQLVNLNSSRSLYNVQTGETYSFQSWDCWQTVYAERTTTTQTLTVALNGSGAGEVLWPPGAEIEIISNSASLVNPVIAGAVGVTISAPQGLVIPTGARAYLKRRTTNQWRLSIITSAQTIGASYIDAAAAIGGRDTLDFVPLLQGLYADPATAGKHIIYRQNRAWISLVKPTTGLGPQSQYLTPPQNSTHEWEPGALWDFSAYTTSGVVIYFRPADGTLGTPLTVVGTVAKGATSITVSSGGTTLKLGDRLLLCNTTALTTLVGAFTLVDAFGTQAAARGETVIAAGPAVAGVIPLASKTRDTYDTSATPLLYPYQNEPRIKLINPTMRAPAGTNSHGGILVGAGRDFQSDGGTLTSFGGVGMMGVNSVMGGHVKDLTMISNEGPGGAGGGLTICGDTSSFMVENNSSYWGSQMFMLSVDSPFYGVTRDVTLKSNNAYNAQNGFSTHNMHESISFIDNYVYGSSGAGIDIRCPNCVVRGGVVDGAGAAGLIFRINPNGLVVDGLTVKNSLGAIDLRDSTTNWDYSPSDITLRNLTLTNIGGSGAPAAIACAYSQAPGVTLGPLNISNVEISKNDNVHCIDIGGKWKSPKVDGARVIAAAGASPSGRSVLIDGAGNGAGEGPIDPFVRVTQSATFAVPIITDTTGRITLSTGVEGTTTSQLNVMATSGALSAEQGMTPMNSGIYVNTGASALVEVTMPLASSPRLLKFQFNVVDGDGFRLIAQPGDTFQIGSGAPGATGGSLTSTTANAWAIVTATTSVKWIAQVDDPANWTVA